MMSTIAVTDKAVPTRGFSVAFIPDISSTRGALPWLTPPNPRIGVPAALNQPMKDSADGVSSLVTVNETHPSSSC